MREVANSPQSPEATRLIQERVSGPEVLLKLFVTLADLRPRLQPRLVLKPLPREGRGGPPQLSAAAVLPRLVGGAWRGLRDNAKLYYSVGAPHAADFPGLGS